MLEFVGIRWRTLCATLPGWGVGVIFFGGSIKMLPYWRHMCYLTAFLAALFFLFTLYVISFLIYSSMFGLLVFFGQPNCCTLNSPRFIGTLIKIQISHRK